MAEKNVEERFYGVDVGKKNIVISYADPKLGYGRIVENSLSKKISVTYVGKNNDQIIFGQVAENQYVRNNKNILLCPKEYFLTDSTVLDSVKKSYPTLDLENNNGHIAVVMNKEPYELDVFYFFCAIHYLSIINNPNPQIVLTYPPYYTAKELSHIKYFYEVSKKARLDDFIPEYLAVSLAYGYENNSRITDEGYDIIIVDIGHHCFTAIYCHYSPNYCDVKSVAYTTELNGELVDNNIMKILRDRITTEHGDKLNLEEKNPRNMKNHVKILKTTVNIKEKLSAAGASDINAEINDIIPDGDNDYEDFSTRVSVDDIARIVKEDLQGETVICGLLDKCLENVDESVKSKMNIVIVGGTTRIPCIKDILNDYVKNKLQSSGNLIFTLNQDEALCSGISYYAAIKKNWWKYSYTVPSNNPCRMIYNLNSGKMTESDNVQKCDKYELSKEEKDYVNNLNGIINNFMQETDLLREKSSILNDIEALCYEFDRLESKIKSGYISRREETFSTIRNPQTKSKSIDDLKFIYDDMKKIMNNCELFNNKYDEFYKLSDEYERNYNDCKSDNYDDIIGKEKEMVYSNQMIKESDVKDYSDSIDIFKNEFDNMKTLKEKMNELQIKIKTMSGSFMNILNINHKRTAMNIKEMEGYINELENSIESNKRYNNIVNVMKNIYRGYGDKLLDSIKGKEVISIVSNLNAKVNQHKKVLEEYEKEKKDYEENVKNYKNNFKNITESVESIEPEKIDEIISRINSNTQNMKKVYDVVDKLNKLSKEEKETESYKEFKKREYSPKEFPLIDEMIRKVRNECKLIREKRELENEIKPFTKNLERKDDFERLKVSKPSQNVINDLKEIREEVKEIINKRYEERVDECNDIKRIGVIDNKLSRFDEKIKGKTLNELDDKLNEIDTLIKDYYNYCYKKMNKDFPNEFKKINVYNEYVDSYNKYKEMKNSQAIPSENEPLINNKSKISQRTPKEKGKRKNKEIIVDVGNDKNNNDNHSSSFSLIWAKILLLFTTCFSFIFSCFSSCYDKCCCCCSSSKKNKEKLSDVGVNEDKTPFLTKKEKDKMKYNQKPNYSVNDDVDILKDNIWRHGTIISVNNDTTYNVKLISTREILKKVEKKNIHVHINE